MTIFGVSTTGPIHLLVLGLKLLGKVATPYVPTVTLLLLKFPLPSLLVGIEQRTTSRGEPVILELEFINVPFTPI